MRIRWAVAGEYTWLSVVPDGTAMVIYSLYIVLAFVAAITLWFRPRLGSVLALFLAVTQLVRTGLLANLAAQSFTPQALAWWWVLSLLFPVMVGLLLGLVYLERRRSRL